MIKYSLMLDRAQGDNTPLYPPVEQMVGFTDWASTIETRSERLQQFVYPRLCAEASRINNPNATSFLQTAIDELYRISQTRFSGSGRFPSEIPIYCLLDRDQQQAPKYNLNGVRGTHGYPTIAAAQAVVDAICPELGIQITENNESLFEKTERAKPFGFAKFSDTGGDYYAAYCGTLTPIFSTILPGVNLSLTCRTDGRYVSLDWQVM